MYIVTTWAALSVIAAVDCHRIPTSDELIWRVLTRVERTIEPGSDPVDLTDHARFENGVIVTQSPTVAAWLQLIAETNPDDPALDEQDLLAPLLLESVMSDPEIVPLFRGGLPELADGLKAQRDAATEKRDRIREEAAAEVAAWDDEAWAQSLWRRGEEEQAADAIYRENYGRHERRQRRALKVRRDLIKQLIETTDPAAANQLKRAYIEVTMSARMNDDLGMWPQIGARAWKFFDRFLDWAFGPGVEYRPPAYADPADGTWWSHRKPQRITPCRIYAGPWFKEGKEPVLPDPHQNLMLDKFRNLDGDGFHPSVGVLDGRNQEWKAKMFQRHYLSTETVTSRLFYALGYNTEPTYFLPTMQLEPRALAAAFRYQNSVLGITPFKPNDVVTEVKLKDGTVLTGDDAIEAFEDAMDDPPTLDDLAHVRVQYSELIYKGMDQDAIGPWHYDQLGHNDRTEVRGVGLIISWLLGEDYKFNNVRLDVREKDDGEYKIIHMMSDVGEGLHAHELPTDVPWEVNIRPYGSDVPLFHNNQNAYVVKAFDELGEDGAKWIGRLIGTLSEDQIVAAFAAGSLSWPLARYRAEVFISRRDDLVKKLGLAEDVGLLRPDGPNKELSVVGDGLLKLDGCPDIRIPEGDYRVVRGRVETTPKTAPFNVGLEVPLDWGLYHVPNVHAFINTTLPAELEPERLNREALVALSPTLESVNVVIEELPPDITLRDYARISRVGMERIFGESLQLGRASRVSIAGNDARKWESDFEYQGKQMHTVTYVIVKDQRGYVVTGASSSEEFDRYRRELERVAESLTLTRTP